MKSMEWGVFVSLHHFPLPFLLPPLYTFSSQVCGNNSATMMGVKVGIRVG
jgi:hypothetical protein